jgi:hypothetical protein
VRGRLRAPLAALAALLIGGALAGRGLDALTDLPGFLYPYVFLFLVFEVLRARRGLRDEDAFLVGAALGLIRDGIYAKTLQDGGLALGVDVPGALTSAFDWGMITVLSLHAVDAVLPREERRDRAGAELILAGVVAACAFVDYLFSTVTGRYRWERMIGDGWLAADLAFAAAAYFLLRRAWRGAAEEEPPERARITWALAAFAAWLAGAQLLARIAGEPTGFVAGFLLLVWTGALGFGAWRLWAERGYVDPEPRRASRAALGLLGWRLLACAAIAWAFVAPTPDSRAAGAFQLFVDLPSRLLFAWIFFTARLAV